VQIYADVLNERISLAASDQSVALGAAILGALAAGPGATGHPSVSQSIHAMAPQCDDLLYRPDLRARKEYAHLYALYRRLADDETVTRLMHDLRDDARAGERNDLAEDPEQ
jgi:L-ribulokinase